jgi:hypothetical protein
MYFHSSNRFIRSGYILLGVYSVPAQFPRAAFAPRRLFLFHGGSFVELQAGQETFAQLPILGEVELSEGVEAVFYTELAAQKVSLSEMVGRTWQTHKRRDLARWTGELGCGWLGNSAVRLTVPYTLRRCHGVAPGR